MNGMHKLAFGLLVSVAASAAPVSADNVKLTARYQGPFASTLMPGPPPGLQISGTLTDPNASFGLTNMAFSVFLNVANSPNTLDNGAFTLSGAGPDKLFATYTGTATGPGADNIVDLSANYIVTGGEGAFAGATGSGVWTGQANVATGQDVHVLTGAVTTNGAIPEPNSLVLLSLGAGYALRLRRRFGA